MAIGSRALAYFWHALLGLQAVAWRRRRS